MASSQDRFDEENRVMRSTGLSRQEVRGLGPEQFTTLANEAKSQKFSGANYSGGDTSREDVLRQLREARAKDADKPLPGTPEALLRTVERREEPLVGPRYNEADAEEAADAEGGGGGSNTIPKHLIDIVWVGSPNFVLRKTFSDGTTEDITTGACS